jgi:hypothetical protein
MKQEIKLFYILQYLKFLLLLLWRYPDPFVNKSGIVAKEY